MPKGSTVTVDLPPENHHQKHEISKKPESTPPGFFNYGTAEFIYIWWFELFVKFIAFVVTLRTLTSIWTPIDNCLDLISEWPWIGSFVLFAWILWIPIIGFVWYSLGTNNWEFLWPYLIYSLVFLFINLFIYTILAFSLFYPSIKEEISNPNYNEVANDFNNQSKPVFWSYLIMVCCYCCFDVVKFLREKYFLVKTEP